MYSVASVGVVMRVAGPGAARGGPEHLRQAFATHHCGAAGADRAAAEICCVAVCRGVPIPPTAPRLRAERSAAAAAGGARARVDVAASADGSGRVCVWDVHTTELLADIWNNGRNSDAPEGSHAVGCMCFSEDGRYLALVGTDAMHTVSIYEWAKHRPAAAAAGGSAAQGAAAAAAAAAAPGQVPGGRLLLSCVGERR